MATASQSLITATVAWTDIAAVNGSLSGVDVLIQNLNSDTVDIVAGGSTAPVGKGPVRLDTFDSLKVNADHIWVRGTGPISATLV